mgnify:FL=1
MSEDMSSIPPRVGMLETEVHTVKYRIDQLEASHKDMPHRLTVLEMAIERLPKIEDKLASMSNRLNQIFYTIAGFGIAFAAWQMGPEILKFLGSR